ncbi:uncharacterized protein LOC144442265 isoform X2 [Glandiceps talaboti]
MTDEMKEIVQIERKQFEERQEKLEKELQEKLQMKDQQPLEETVSKNVEKKEEKEEGEEMRKTDKEEKSTIQKNDSSKIDNGASKSKSKDGDGACAHKSRSDTSVKSKKKSKKEGTTKSDYKVHVEGAPASFFGLGDGDDDDDFKPPCGSARYKLDLVVKPAEKTISIKAEQISDDDEPDDDGGNVMIKAKKYLEESNCRKAREIYEKALEENPKCKEALIGMYRVYRRAGRITEALDYIKKADEFYPHSYKINQMLGDTYLEIRQGRDALLAFTTCMRSRDKMSKRRLHDIQVGLCRSFLQAGKKTEGLRSLQSLLRENLEHHKALLEYASMIYQRTSLAHKESITMVLTVITQSKGKDKQAIELLIKLLRHQNGMKYLQSEIHDAWNSFTALSFLGNNLRDFGAIPEATKILQRAVDVEPENPRPLLNLMHLYEVQNRHQEAVEMALLYLKENKSLNVAGVQCSSFVPLIECVKSDIYLNGASPGMSGIVITVVHPEDRVYTDDELYLLAVLFTLVKILFIKGSTRLLHGINRLLDPCHKGRDLHLTLIRNEAAYYATISQLMTINMYPLPQNPKFIYFASDSHCLTPAWRTIEYKGSPHTIHPLLATGCKIWHLRPEGVFYPKESFFSMMKVVPKRSTVIFNMGEIDCREGILFAVEKCKYDNMEDGIAKVIDIYLKVMKKLKSLYNLRIFVHPVNPVLDMTRTMVMRFNLALEEAVRSMPGLSWLDFVGELVSHDRKDLDPQYYLDQTHLHPSYLTLLEQAINQKYS